MGTAQCPGDEASFAIKRHLALGGVVQTDVFELLLRDPVADAPVSDETACTSMAVALRQAAAEDLNIDPRELGWATTDAHGPDGQARAIVLFDIAEGGAGYVASVAERLPRLLVRAREILSCDCDRACHKCLLSFDTQFAIDHLDWRAGRAVITDALLGALELPGDLRVFGTTTRLECSPLLSALLTELRRPDSETCRVYLAGDTGDWDFGEWPLWPHLVRAASEGRSVVLVVPEERLAELPWDEANALASRSEGTGIAIEVSAGRGIRTGDTWLALEVGGKNRASRWACTAEGPLTPGIGWGTGDAETRFVRADADRALEASPARAARTGELRKAKPGQFTEVLFRHELDGLVAETGKKFWSVLARAVPALEGRLGGPSPLEELRYLYLPRLTARQVIDLAVQDGAAVLNADDTFGVAAGYDEAKKRFTGLKIGDGQPGVVDRTTLLVKTGVARAQREKERGPSSPPGRHDSGQMAGVGAAGAPTSQRATVVAKQPPNVFVGSVKLDGLRVVKEAGRVAMEVVEHLSTLPDAEVDVTLEIRVRVPDGVKDDVVRTVSENAKTLKFQNFTFERE